MVMFFSYLLFNVYSFTFFTFLLFYRLTLSFPSVLLLCRRKQAAGGKDVLSTTGTNRREDTMQCQIVPELLHLLVVNTLQWSIGNRMKTDEVDAAVQSFEQAHDGLGMSFRVV